uniref:Myb-like domain-containing protein n=1 Tax=Oryza meridionalis TaxID=40149 RepID=A0A0E0BZB7_9ORYZ
MHRSGSDPDSDRAHWYRSNSDDESFIDKDKDCRRGTIAPLLKKGPWTSWEDSILEKYIKKHGERNCKPVQKNTGLLRCGKSCCLRWMNHLRPNLKKWAFSKEEENKIINLHRKIGNKWSRMAIDIKYISLETLHYKYGERTDNEIKNYWNTRIKKCKNNRLLLYPANVCNDALNEDQYGSQLPGRTDNEIKNYWNTRIKKCKNNHQYGSQLPGRTDNEIKNYWNTRIKKCKNNRLLLYPANVCNDALNEDQYGSEKLTNNQLEDTTNASISNILDRRLASKDYDSIEDQRNRIEVAMEYEIPLLVLKTTNNDIFPSGELSPKPL